VLLVIANRDFYYSEYSQTRAALESAGVGVRVAASEMADCVPHFGSGQGSGSGIVRPDLALTEARADDYSAIVFVGGWGASYQYAFSGTYANSAYNGSARVEQAANELINDFVAQDKYVCGLCHGVSVLAYARVDGHSLLEGRTVATYEGYSPGFLLDGVFHGLELEPLAHRGQRGRRLRLRFDRRPDHPGRRCLDRWQDHHRTELQQRHSVRPGHRPAGVRRSEVSHA
jgi:putative intracellular protease/amidase